MSTQHEFYSKYNWSKSCLSFLQIEVLQCVKFIFVKRSSVYVSKNLIIYNTTRKTSALISCWCGGKRRQEKSSCTHIKQRWCCSLWTKTKNLFRKLFSIKSAWDICFPSISYYFHIPKNFIFWNFIVLIGKNRNRWKSNLLP